MAAATIQLHSKRNIFIITAIAFVIFIGGVCFLHLVSVAVRNKVANGLLADFVLTFPVLYYLIIVRPLKVPAKSMVLVFSICCALAYLILPPQQRDYILQIRKLSVVAELAFIIYAITKFKQIRAAYVTDKTRFADPVYNLRFAMAKVLGESLPIKVLASELAVLRYGLLCWVKTKPVGKNAVAFSTYKESGYIAIWSVLLFVVMIEVTAFHLLINKWSHAAALTVTILSLYGAVFLIADLSAIVKRNILITGDQLILRTGLRWNVHTTVSNIASVQKITGDHVSGELYLKGGVLKSNGNLLIIFKNPVQVDKLYGPAKNYSLILMNIDDYEGFKQAVENRN